MDYLSAAKIMLRSLFYNNRGYDIKIFLFHSELDTKSINTLCRLIEHNNATLFVKKIDDGVMKDVPVSALSKETYYRLMAPGLLPENLDRILYLDIDMIVTGDIKKMYDADFGENLFMAVPDTSSGLEIVKRNLHMKKSNVYINAGVLLMNLELLRREFNLNEALDYARKYPERVPNCDQDVINGLYSTRIGYLEWMYNYEARFHSVFEIVAWPFQYRRLQEKIRIIHYMGGKKPWKAGFCGKYLREYYRYARHTEFQDRVEKNMRNRFVNITCFIWNEFILQALIGHGKELIDFYESIGLWNRSILSTKKECDRG